MSTPPARQPELFTRCELCGARLWHGRGRLVVTMTPDGRAVLRLEDGTARGTWLELLPEDSAWLAEVLRGILAARDG